MKILKVNMAWMLGILYLQSSLVSAQPANPAPRFDYGPSSTLPSGWTEYSPGGDTMCAHGGPFSFFVYPGDPEKVVVDFVGGGACHDAVTCGPGNLSFVDNIDGTRLLLSFGLSGPNDFANPLNPIRDWTHVLIPYCTGDVHWGNKDVTYTNPDGSQFVIHHRGAVNANAVFAWTKANMPQPKKLFVTGCSGGAYASIFYTPQLRKQFPDAELNQFADSAVAVAPPEQPGLNKYGWNMEAAAPTWIPDLDPKMVDYAKLNMTDYYIRAAKFYPDVHFAQYTSAYDVVQTAFYPSKDKTAWNPGMFKALHEIKEVTPNFNYYIAEGSSHCGAWDDQLYSTNTGSVSLVDWLKSASVGVAEPDVACDLGQGACD